MYIHADVAEKWSAVTVHLKYVSRQDGVKICHLK